MEEQKPIFKPVITRIKLNPEQAVLQCNCYSIGWWIDADNGTGPFSGCVIGAGKVVGSFDFREASSGVS